MRVRTYHLLTECIDRGIVGGLAKAGKRDLLDLENRNLSAICELIQQYVMNEVCEYFDWDDEV